MNTVSEIHKVPIGNYCQVRLYRQITPTKTEHTVIWIEAGKTNQLPSGWLVLGEVGPIYKRARPAKILKDIYG